MDGDYQTYLREIERDCKYNGSVAFSVVTLRSIS